MENPVLNAVFKMYNIQIRTKIPSPRHLTNFNLKYLSIELTKPNLSLKCIFLVRDAYLEFATMNLLGTESTIRLTTGAMGTCVTSVMGQPLTTVTGKIIL